MEHIDPELLRRYTEGNCTPEEKKAVASWLKEETNFFSDDTIQAVNDKQLEQEIWEKVQQQIAVKHQARPAPVRTLWPRLVAAACLIGFIAAGWFLFKTRPGDITEQSASIPFKRYIVPKGARSRLVLPDSTVIHLMGGSVIAYPETFASAKREVVLEKGEVFLEVAHNPQWPFVLRSAGSEIKVLGTKFNVRNRDKDPVVTVTLTEGSIRFTSAASSQLLKPGEQLQYDKLKQLITGVKTIREKDRVAGWTEGKLHFKEEPLHNALSRLEDYYGVHFIIKDKVNLNVPLTATIDNLPLKQVLTMMAFSTHLRFGAVDSIIQVSSK
ncbi:FecR family protein [Niabella aquatica]